MEEALNILETRAVELVKEEAKTLEELNSGLRLINCVLATRERWCRLQNGNAYPGLLINPED